MPPPYRQRLWASVPFGPLARVATFQVVACSVLFSQVEQNKLSRLAVVFGGCVGLVTLPLARLGAALSRNHPRVYWWAGRVWTTAVPLFMTLTIPDAFDGTGVVFAERATAPFVMGAVVGLGFAIGAQGALLGVPTEALVNMVALMLGMAVLKLHHAYTPAYMALHVAFFGSLALGYACVKRYADHHEAIRDAAEELMRAAVAITQPYLITDDQLRILAVNQRFADVLGYEADEVYGMHASTLLETSIDTEWVETVLSQERTDHVWSVVRKDQATMPVRITLGETRCPVNATKFYCAKLASMALEQRNMQLQAEKERLQWDLASQQSDSDWEDPRERLGASWYDADAVHRTLGAMQDQALVAKAVSTAHSYDHVDSRDASPVASPPLQGTSPPPPPSVLSIGSASIVSLKSSVMDTTSQAAAKDVTRAPPPTKSTRLPRPKRVCSEPSCTPTTNSMPRAPRRGPLPVVERVGPDPREDC